MIETTSRRLSDVHRFYDLLDLLENKIGGKRTLGDCHGRMNFPTRGVYFFFENGEDRITSGNGMRVTRVGTHALKTGSKTTLWNRLKQHRGTDKDGGGNHRGSIFRLHVGVALSNREKWPAEIKTVWPKGQSAPIEIRNKEIPYENQVSQYIRKMPFLWLAVEDAPGPDSLRGYIERNSIALLSNASEITAPNDPPSDTWLGKWTGHNAITRSGLWNVNHVFDNYSPDFLAQFEELILRMD